MNAQSNVLLRLPLISWFIRKRAEKKAAEAARKQLNEEYEKAREFNRVRDRMMRFPLKSLSQAEFDALPKASEINLRDCPYNTWFACRPDDRFPNLIVIGQVVMGEDLIAAQWGAGLSIPERGINRYRLNLV